MKIIQKIFLVIIFSFSFTSFALEKMEPEFPNIVGEYKCHGYDPFADEKNYLAHYSIEKKGGTYFFEWVDNKGYPTAYGIGILNDTLKKTIAVAYINLNNEYKGIILYKISSDGSLDGIWTAAGDTVTGTESCKRQ